ncbi:MAG TPA: poly(R)-hydroxyalkanoic acid synthase subunit PhaE [Syntrophales bacterium]|nr:poly(R)-hydroxyalkanoic acid synthase subunit PhaE [Syntrophales bacterium]
MEETQSSWNDVMSQWMRFQESLWKEWLTFAEKSMESMTGVAKMGVAVGDKTAAPWNLYQSWFESFQKVFAEKSEEGLGATVFNRTFHASRVYLDLLDFWSKTLSSLKDFSIGEPLSVEKIRDIRQRWIGQYQSMMESLWGGVPSAELKETANALSSASVAASDLAWSFIEPTFKNMTQVPGVLEKVVKGDRSAVADLGGIFVKNYEETIGKALLAPSVGYFKEFNERVNNMMYACIQFNTSKAAFYSLFYATGIKAAERVYDKFTEFVGKEMTPETFREFYRIWWTINEDVYQELFRSEEFSKLSREVNSRGLLFRKWIDDVFEQILKFTSLPSKRDMDEIYRSLYDLKKEVRNQKRTMKELEERLGKRNSKRNPSL